MSYSGSEIATSARKDLGKALEGLQAESGIPDDVMAVASNIAQAVGALFDAENADTEAAGKSAVQRALDNLSQTLTLLQEVRSEYSGVQSITEQIAGTMGTLFPLRNRPSQAPVQSVADTIQDSVPAVIAQQETANQAPASQPPADQPPSSPPNDPVSGAQRMHSDAPPPPADPGGQRASLEANIGASTSSNFFVGFSGDINKGGVFVGTYDILPLGTRCDLLVTLPGGFSFEAHGWVRFARDPFDLGADGDAEPGVGVQFEKLEEAGRMLAMRFIRKRPPMFYDD